MGVGVGLGVGVGVGVGVGLGAGVGMGVGAEFPVFSKLEYSVNIVVGLGAVGMG